MKSSEYDKLDPIFIKLETEFKYKCEDNGVEYYDYLGLFVRYLLPNYVKAKELITTVKGLDFNDIISTRAILNRRNFNGKKQEIDRANEEFRQTAVKLFNWLDKVDEPFYFIMNPLYKYGAGIDYESHISTRYGYLKDRFSGSHNLEIAVDYARYKLNKKLK